LIVDDNNTQDPAPQPIRSNPNRWNIGAIVTLQHWRRSLVVFGLLCGLSLLLCGAYLAFLIRTTPDIDNLQQARTARPSVVLAADGQQLAMFKQAQQEWVSLDRISPYVIKALVSTEDHRFYEHDGVDFGRTLSAIMHTAGGDAQGGSTITQQLARNMFPEEIGRSRTVSRKLKEIIAALHIEHQYSKQQILETYLNTVPFLYNVTGIEMAARTYYDKSAAQLDALQSATLVGMLKGTHYYNPVLNPDRARNRRNVVLAQMVKHQQLSESDFQALREQPLQVRFTRQQEQQDESASHFIAHVRKWASDWAEQNDVDLYADGLVIQTTIDLTLQQAATRAVEQQSKLLQEIADVEWGQRSEQLISSTPGAYATLHKRVEPFRYFWSANPALTDEFVRDTPEFRKAVDAHHESEAAAVAKLKANADFMARLRATKTRLEAGFVAMDPITGEVKAWVGSRDFERDQFDHVAQAARQPGSTFKPIVYGAALEQGLSPDRAYRDDPVAIRSVDGSVWRPTDMAGTSGRPMTLREGLIYSKNTITAQVMQDVGLPSIVNLARAVGINQSKLDPVPSLALGTSPVTLLEMVSAYSTIANVGEYHKPVFIKRITDRSGKVLAEFGGQQSQRALSENAAIDLIDIMRGVVSRGTGQAVKTRFGIVADIAGKTGTTQNNTDGWFILMHPNLVAGAWVGFNDARVTMRSNYWGQGGHNAILVVGDFFREALKNKLIDVKAQFPRPKRMPLMAAAKTPPDDWHAQLDAASDDDMSAPPPGTGVIIHRDGSRIIVGDAPGVEAFRRNDSASAKTSEQLGRILSGMGRDPMSGARMESSGGNGTEAISEGDSGAGSAPRAIGTLRPDGSAADIEPAGR
jgi:penicillin-binding protein 1A